MDKEIDYESKANDIKKRNMFGKGILMVLIVVALLIPTIEYWETSSQMRGSLRSAKNVLRNMELISLEHFGLGKNICDLSRPSGMTKSAEEKVKLFSGAEGVIRLEEWDEKNHVVIRLTYVENGFILQYTRLPEEEINKRALKDGVKGTWKIYRKVREYDAL